ncbi:MAG: DUF1772 domain-containing protein [Acidobacteria bacterium]|nr:DUF1772 domain-containing protein [Acidobacteriota bacterium]
MQTACDVLQLLSAVTIGLLAGALLTEGCLLVPYWRSLPADKFHALYRELHPHLYRYFTPITVAPLLLSLAAVIVSMLLTDAGRWPLVIAFGLCLCAAATHSLYFKKANTQFAAAALAPDALAAELKRWAIWHWLRTGLAVVAFGAALVSLTL